MHTGRGTPPAAAVASALLLSATACASTSDEPPQESPPPEPPVLSGEQPPGLGDTPVRLLDDPDADSPDILEDAMGVRIQSLGSAFLISSNSEERHLLQSAADGQTLWEGSERVQRFTTDRTGTPVLVLEEADNPDQVTVRTADGEQVWTTDDPRERFVTGWVVRQPEDWSPDEPAGEYSVLDLDGSEVWSYTVPELDASAAEATTDAEETDEEEPRPRGLPLGARNELLFRASESGVLEARDLADDGAARWQVGIEDVADTSEGADPALPTPTPQIIGIFPVPTDDRGDGDERRAPRAPADATDSPAVDGQQEDEPDDEQLLVRWSYPEHPSVLAMVDLDDGHPLWSLTEPGANPAEDQATPRPPSGTVANPESHTVVIPQHSGDVPVIAVDLGSGDIRWVFEDEVERTIVPTFSVGPYLYGDSRSTADHTQVVLDAASKELVVDEPDAYVETVTSDGHALVVQDQQRYVFPVEAGATGSEPPEADGERPNSPEDE
ncbi:hypothetical protein RIF23_14410 [Lipingzhangella sp. LS1_29]|uniref:Pyrroloquinoline-quinone binding quinoprotein n=1 Tax=Lipingzhangella rawalii TaxID=2055835 RepID=A0ABU2H890_9ACTN|nr:hypothetical protein [Lipingzhangella rawalii]MDS1271488.1 hypothetical protein [Lipingzhangella rawalii]